MKTSLPRIGTLVEGHGDDPVYACREAFRKGFESVQMTFWKTTARHDLARVAAETRSMAAKFDAEISCVGIYGNPLEADEDGIETLRSWTRLINSAPDFGTDLVCGFTGRLRGKSIDQSIPRFKEVFDPLADLASRRGVRIAFENCAMGGDFRSGDWNIAHGPDAWELIFEAVSGDHIGLEWEPCHQMLNLIDPIAQLRRWAHRIFHVHGKDAVVLCDSVKRFGTGSGSRVSFHRTPGFGTSDWADIIRILLDAGYTGTIDVEGWHDPIYREGLELVGQSLALGHLLNAREQVSQ